LLLTGRKVRHRDRLTLTISQTRLFRRQYSDCAELHTKALRELHAFNSRIARRGWGLFPFCTGRRPITQRLARYGKVSTGCQRQTQPERRTRHTAKDLLGNILWLRGVAVNHKSEMAV